MSSLGGGCRRRSLSIDTAVARRIKRLPCKDFETWLEGENAGCNNVFVVDTRKGLEGGMLPNSHPMVISELASQLPGLIDRISAAQERGTAATATTNSNTPVNAEAAPKTSKSDPAVDIVQIGGGGQSRARLVFVSLTGSEDFDSIVPQNINGGNGTSIPLDMFFLEGGLLKLINVPNFDKHKLLEGFDETLWVMRDSALVYGPDVAFDFGAEANDGPATIHAVVA